MQQVEETVEPGAPLPEHLLRGLHATTVAGLAREGDPTPGAYRQGPVRIAQAEHLPPEAAQVPGYMTELVTFINQADAPKYDLMKVALAHHRFAWIHPFGNGNGRVVRLLTYAMLLKYGFRVNTVGRLLNPAAVFCADRNAYYARLGDADSGSDAALERWCVYVLSGVRDELTKVDRLTDYDHLKTRVLLAAVAYARERQHITPQGIRFGGAGGAVLALLRYRFYPSNCGCSCRMRFIAIAAAAVRVSTPSLANTRSRCFFTVAGLAPRMSAMSRLILPLTTQ